MNKYRILEVIGDGTYGTVYKGINTETNEKVAIKKLKAKVKSINECMNMNEVKIVKKCNHENIIKLYEIIHDCMGSCIFISLSDRFCEIRNEMSIPLSSVIWF